MSPFHFEEQFPIPAGGRKVVVPVGLKNKADLLAFLCHAVPLPDYFGHNWDALEECLGELDWLDSPIIVLVHQDIPLEDAPQNQRIYIHILAAAARESDRLCIVFPEKSRSQIKNLLGSS